jgi:hypothetical protein
VDFFATMRLIARRWYVVVSALIVSLAVAFTVMQSVAPNYRAQGSVLLFAPSAAADPAVGAPVNPFRSFDASTAVLAAVTVQIMGDTDVRLRVAEQGGRPDYQVGQATDGTPVIITIATDPDKAKAIETVNVAMDELQVELDRRQADAGAPENIRIRAIVLTAPTDASALVGGRIRAFLAVFAIGAAASISLAFIVEGVSQSRRRAADSRVAEWTGLDVGDGTDPDVEPHSNGSVHPPEYVNGADDANGRSRSRSKQTEPRPE